MKISQLSIYSGLFIIFSSLGSDIHRFIPSWLGISIGSLFVIYGVVKEFKIDKALKFNWFDYKINWLRLPSKIYIITGIFLVRIHKFVESINNSFELYLFFVIAGVLLMLYGLALHFKEKKHKKESGDIEK